MLIVDLLKHLPCEEVLELKLNARVMLIKNLDVDNGLRLLFLFSRSYLLSGLANGSIGQIVRFQATGHPVVKFKNIVRTIIPEKWPVHHNVHLTGFTSNYLTNLEY